VTSNGRVPSIELRRVLFRYPQTRERLGINEPLMFPCDGGRQWNQRNALRSFYLFQKRLGLQRVGFHRPRHTLATEYLRNGGDVVRLSRTLGQEPFDATLLVAHTLGANVSGCLERISSLQRLESQRLFELLECRVMFFADREASPRAVESRRQILASFLRAATPR